MKKVICKIYLQKNLNAIWKQKQSKQMEGMLFFDKSTQYHKKTSVFLNQFIYLTQFQ